MRGFFFYRSPLLLDAAPSARSRGGDTWLQFLNSFSVMKYLPGFVVRFCGCVMPFRTEYFQGMTMPLARHAWL